MSVDSRFGDLHMSMYYPDFEGEKLRTFFNVLGEYVVVVLLI